MNVVLLCILYGIGFLTVIAFPLMMHYAKTEFSHMVVVILGSVVFQAPAVYDLFDGHRVRGIIMILLYFGLLFGFSSFVSRIYWADRGKNKC